MDLASDRRPVDMLLRASASSWKGRKPCHTQDSVITERTERTCVTHGVQPRPLGGTGNPATPLYSVLDTCEQLSKVPRLKCSVCQEEMDFILGELKKELKRGSKDGKTVK